MIKKELLFFEWDSFGIYKEQVISQGYSIISISDFLKDITDDSLYFNIDTANTIVDISVLASGYTDCQALGERLLDKFSEFETIFIADKRFEDRLVKELRYRFLHFNDIKIILPSVTGDKLIEDLPKSNIKSHKKITDLTDAEIEEFCSKFRGQLYGHEKFKDEFHELIKNFKVFNKLGEHKVLSLFLMGESGVGKTEVAKTIYNCLRYSLMANLPSPDTLNGSDPNPQQLLLSALSFQLRGIKKANLQPNNFIQDNISEHFDVIIANPPFGQKFNKPHQINEVVIKNAEIVFIDKIADTLSPTGRATIIVSEGFLSNTNSQHMQCRKKLFTQYRLEGGISLPSGIFLNTQAKSSILILSKDEHNNRPDVWFYELQNDGYTNDRAKRRTKEFPLPEVVKAFRERQYNSQNKRTETCFFVSFEEIQRNDYNLSYSRYKQFNYERQDHGDVCEMMQEIIHNERDIQNILNELESTFIWKK